MHTELQRATFSLVYLLQQCRACYPGPLPCCLGLVPVLSRNLQVVGGGAHPLGSLWSIALGSPLLTGNNQKLVSGAFLFFLAAFFVWAGLGAGCGIWDCNLTAQQEHILTSGLLAQLLLCLSHP